MQRGIEAKSVTENTKSILAPMAGERICGRTEWNESGKRADGANCDRVTIAELCERKANSRQEAIVHERLVSVTSAGAGELAANSGDEHESIVGWGCEIADEWLTRGARNVIHICDSNMNGSSEREAISRRYADNETIISWIPSLSLGMT